MNVLSYALAIHTASPDLGLGLSNFAGESRYQTWALGRELSTQLHVYLAEFIQPQIWTNLAFIAVAKGPGGFTGTRVGMVTARTLAQQLKVPLFGVSTLAAIAQNQQSRFKADPSHFAWTDSVIPDIAVQMPAHRGEIYTAIYTIQPTLNLEGSENQDTCDRPPTVPELVTRLADSVMSEDQWQQTLADWPTPYHLVQAEGGLGATAQNVLELAYWRWLRGDRPEWSAVLPFYGQSPV